MRFGCAGLADRRSFMFVAACVSTAWAWQIGEAASDGTVEWTGSYGSSGEALISRDTASIMHFQQPQPQPSVAAATDCPHAGSGLVPWNSGTLQWPGRVGPPPAGEIMYLGASRRPASDRDHACVYAQMART